MKTYLIAAQTLLMLALTPVAGWAADRVLSFAVSGVVAEVKVQAGASVQKGDVLAVLDLTPFQAKKRAADGVVKASQVIFDLADRRLGQVQDLFDALSISAEDVEIAETTQANAKMALENARAQQILATWQLNRATLKAPFAGTVASLPGYPGMVINLQADTSAVAVVVKAE